MTEIFFIELLRTNRHLALTKLKSNIHMSGFVRKYTPDIHGKHSITEYMINLNYSH